MQAIHETGDGDHGETVMNKLMLVKLQLLKAARLHQAQLASVYGYRPCVA
jgi:hypothetical protein